MRLRQAITYCVVRRLIVGLSIASFAVLPAAHAQLISPGELSQVHSKLEGISNCVSCHTLGSRGIDNTRCLNCHEALQTRIEASTGLHAEYVSQSCAECHKEHFGTDFELVRFDTTAFDHDEAGFSLTGSHQEASCTNCHQPQHIFDSEVRAFKGANEALDRTFLGLDARCVGCHESESSHGDQFSGDDCSSCHETETWDQAPLFSHDQSRFPLTGRHVDVTCQSCHVPDVSGPGKEIVPYEGIAFSNCSSCHEDNHKGTLGADCQGCHTPNDWFLFESSAEDLFDHATTGFSLVAAHARASCASCHGRPARTDSEINLSFVPGTASHSYPDIIVTDCQSCHVDFHDGEFTASPGGPLCSSCHSQEAWTPGMYDLDRHNADSGFELTGAHLSTPCTACHTSDETNEWSFVFEDTECQTCHADDNPHGNQFDNLAGITICADCHATPGWDITDSFDHDGTKFPLTGQHTQATCASCHGAQDMESADSYTQYRGLKTECQDCHENDDPHRGQFPELGCESCHTTSAFSIADFDHARSRFPLDGAHREARCLQCHQTIKTTDGASFTQYRPVSIVCKDCHTEQ